MDTCTGLNLLGYALRWTDLSSCTGAQRHVEIGSCSYCNSGICSSRLPLWGGLSDRAECLLISLSLCSSWTYVQLLSSYWTPFDFKSKAGALWWRAAIVSSVGVCVNKPGTVRPIIHFVNEIAIQLGLVWNPWRTKAHLSQSQPCISCEADFLSFSHVLCKQTERQCFCDRFYVCPILCTGSFVCVRWHCPRNETRTQRHQNNSHF